MTANELKQWREAMALPQTSAARRLDVNIRTYRYYEQGVTSSGTPLDRIPRAVALAALALKFERDVAREMETP
jgi:transcriptional regulator with XRE-family HTH domain